MERGSEGAQHAISWTVHTMYGSCMCEASKERPLESHSLIALNKNQEEEIN